MKTERIIAKTGMTQSQGEEVAQWLASIFETIGNSGAMIDSLPYKWASASKTGQDWRPYHSMRLEANRELRVYTQNQASNLHYLITGETLGGLPALKNTSNRGYPEPYDVDKAADDIMRVYGHPLYCIAAMERQLAWYWAQSEEDRRRMLKLDHAYDVLERLRGRAVGQIKTTHYGSRGTRFEHTEYYDLNAAMAPLCPEHANRELVVA